MDLLPGRCGCGRVRVFISGFWLVVLDNEEWEREDGVCFVWVGDTGEIIVGRVGRGMRGVERLRGES